MFRIVRYQSSVCGLWMGIRRIHEEMEQPGVFNSKSSSSRESMMEGFVTVKAIVILGCSDDDMSTSSILNHWQNNTILHSPHEGRRCTFKDDEGNKDNAMTSLPSYGITVISFSNKCIGPLETKTEQTVVVTGFAFVPRILTPQQELWHVHETKTNALHVTVNTRIATTDRHKNSARKKKSIHRITKASPTAQPPRRKKTD